MTVAPRFSTTSVMRISLPPTGTSMRRRSRSASPWKRNCITSPSQNSTASRGPSPRHARPDARRRERQPAVQRMAIDGLANMIEAAGDDEAGAAAAVTAPSVVLGDRARRVAKARHALPRQRNAAPPQRADVERTIGKHPEIEAAAAGERQRAHAMLDAVVERDPPHAGEAAGDRRPLARARVRSSSRLFVGSPRAGLARSSRSNASGGASLAAMSSDHHLHQPLFVRRASWIGLSCPGSSSRS